MDFFALAPLIQVLLVVLLFVLAWTALRFVLRLARRLFTCGCLAIFVIGGLYLLLNVALS
jgi:hypothetical protein